MPLSKYFGGKGEKVMSEMKKEYGEDKGKRVFYATSNKMKKKKDVKDQAAALKGKKGGKC